MDKKPMDRIKLALDGFQLLGYVLITCKLFNLVKWSWELIMIPVMIPVVVVVGYFVLELIEIIVQGFKAAKNDKNK